ncbi:MAG TPA: hypothetical protein VMP86_00850, partial [Candidatus Binatia bacterium]|nr:hypothetical protein [Candidatus Binatia bacterium]
MTISRLAPLRLVGAASLALAVLGAIAACASAPTVETPAPAASSAAPTSNETPSPTPSPTAKPTPVPTPRFTNDPDDELAGLIPATAAGVAVTVAPFDEFALMPGDVGGAYDEIGDRFASLVLAYVTQPRASLSAMRGEGEPVATEEL